MNSDPQIRHEFEISLMPVSNNDMYLPRPFRGGKSAYITKSTLLRKFQEAVQPLLVKHIPNELVDSLKEAMKNPQLAIHLGFVFGMPKKEFYKCDASNYVKSIEDMIKDRLKIDDSRNCSVSSRKFLSDDKWITNVVIEVYELEFEVESKWHGWKEK